MPMPARADEGVDTLVRGLGVKQAQEAAAQQHEVFHHQKSIRKIHRSLQQKKEIRGMLPAKLHHA
jgi:hypothetical protein